MAARPRWEHFRPKPTMMAYSTLEQQLDGAKPAVTSAGGTKLFLGGKNGQISCSEDEKSQDTKKEMRSSIPPPWLAFQARHEKQDVRFAKRGLRPVRGGPAGTPFSSFARHFWRTGVGNGESRLPSCWRGCMEWRVEGEVPFHPRLVAGFPCGDRVQRCFQNQNSCQPALIRSESMCRRVVRP